MQVKDTLQLRAGEGKIYLPNEIFSDIQGAIESPTHVAFAYSYTYLVTYLYRYTKYGTDTKYTQQLLKEILGFSPTNKKIDYIVKKNGVLDVLGYTRTTTDYPIQHTIDHKNMPDFVTIQEWKKANPMEAQMLQEDRNYKIKYPVKAFYRTPESEEAQDIDGTFFDAKKTHGIHIEAFTEMMQDAELGTIGFYLYAYLVSRIGQFRGWAAISKDMLVRETGLSNGTVGKYLNTITGKKYIKVSKKDFFDNPDHHANEYSMP